ncbi:MAG: U-box domain [Francisellaceae bacterium]|nr:U-box domain [Francisellaceae bacterium]
MSRLINLMYEIYTKVLEFIASPHFTLIIGKVAIEEPELFDAQNPVIFSPNNNNQFRNAIPNTPNEVNENDEAPILYPVGAPIANQAILPEGVNSRECFFTNLSDFNDDSGFKAFHKEEIALIENSSFITDAEKEEIECPISYQLMRYPVLSRDDYRIYDKQSILDAVAHNDAVCGNNGKELKLANLVPVGPYFHKIHKLIEKAKTEHRVNEKHKEKQFQSNFIRRKYC